MTVVKKCSMATVAERVAAYIGKRSLMRAGERVAMAVSGGADSVALLRVMLELRTELGVVLSVTHFHHGIRGEGADVDAAFVSELAAAHDLELYLERGEARDYSRQKKISLETAAREMRRDFFAKLLREKRISRIATAHTLDDQAETVLMKLLRGAGTRGLAGIFPEQRMAGGSIVRPLLEIHRAELRAYLRRLKQPWREDESNADLSFSRNRVRSRVLPMLRAEVNPSAELALAHHAEVARCEEEYWSEQIKRVLPLVSAPGEPARGGGRKQTSTGSIALDLQRFQQQPVAVQRRLLRAAGEQAGVQLQFDDVRAIEELLARRSTQGAKPRVVEIADGWRARLLFRELRLERTDSGTKPPEYRYPFRAPGEIRVPELDTTIRACISEGNGTAINTEYNRAHSIQLSAFSELVLRNWRAGDRFQPALHGSEKRVKELLYTLHLSAEEKRLWPVVAAGDRIVWVRGIDGPELRTVSGQRLWIEERVD
jgi:tRNA(Ile)-lysidine synthase